MDGELIPLDAPFSTLSSGLVTETKAEAETGPKNEGTFSTLSSGLVTET